MTPEEQTLINQFQLNVDKRDSNSCWEWLGPRDSHGRGEFRAGHRSIKAHVLSWLIFYDSIPDGQEVRRKCSTSSCVNPNHLYLDDKKQGVIYDPKPLPEDFKELEIGTYEWKEFWRTSPHKQEDMLLWKKELMGSWNVTKDRKEL